MSQASLSTDHELFLQAFQKPTQIYRLLGIRNAISPIFLHRNLSYMKDRMSRTHKGRKIFKVDQLLEVAEKKFRTDFQKCKDTYKYMSLMVFGFYNKCMEDQTVQLDVFISNGPQRRRSQKIDSHLRQAESVTINVNPSNTYGKIPTISIPTDYMKPNEYSGCTMTLRVTAKPKECLKSEEPVIVDEQSRIYYETDILIFDKHKRCLLFDAEFEVNLFPTKNGATAMRDEPPKKRSSWEDLTPSPDKYGNYASECYEAFTKLPTLKFRLTWAMERCKPLVDRPLPITIRNDQHFKASKANQMDSDMDKALSNASNGDNNNKTAFVKLYDIASRIIYRFIYNNNSSQQTEACDNFNCPWCNLNCIALYSLMKHLKLCHPRFNFTYVPTEKSVRIDVTLNELFDPSYSGSPFDLVSPDARTSFYVERHPQRRTPVTHILVCHPHRARPTLTEFLEIDENEANAHRPFIAGHNRTYHHIMTLGPIMPKEFDSDSEDENDPVWLRNKTMTMIDDFTDVNDGEKELMKMWNLHVMKYNFVGEIHIPLACDMFLEDRGKELLNKNLSRNFVLHLCSLCDFGLLSPQMLYGVILKMRSILCTNNEGRDVVAKAHLEHLQNWLCQQNDRKTREHKTRQSSGSNRSETKKPRLPPARSPSTRGRTRSSYPPQKSIVTIKNNTNLSRKRTSIQKSPPTAKKYACDLVNKTDMITTRRRRAHQSLPLQITLNRRANRLGHFLRNRSLSQSKDRRSLNTALRRT